MVHQRPDGTIEFQFYRPQAHHVTLSGDFNGWSKTSAPMVPGRDGWWRYVLKLPPGTYQFGYFGDGAWYPDYAAFGMEIGSNGWNAVLQVDAPVHEAERAVAAAQETVRIPGSTTARPVRRLLVRDDVLAGAGT